MDMSEFAKKWGCEALDFKNEDLDSALNRHFSWAIFCHFSHLIKRFDKTLLNFRGCYVPREV